MRRLKRRRPRRRRMLRLRLRRLSRRYLLHAKEISIILKLTSIYQLTDDAYLKVWMHTQAYNALIPVTPDRRHYYQAKLCIANPRGAGRPPSPYIL